MEVTLGLVWMFIASLFNEPGIMIMKSFSYRFGLALATLALVAISGWRFSQRQSGRLAIQPADFPGSRGVPVEHGVTTQLNKPADLFQKAIVARQKVRAGLRHPEVARQQIARALQDNFAALAASRPATPPPPLRGKARGYGRKVPDPDQQQALDEWNSIDLGWMRHAGIGLRVNWAMDSRTWHCQPQHHI